MYVYYVSLLGGAINRLDNISHLPLLALQNMKCHSFLQQHDFLIFILIISIFFVFLLSLLF
jgi:hypothetical protein